jgi:hypothetical protein
VIWRMGDSNILSYVYVAAADQCFVCKLICSRCKRANGDNCCLACNWDRREASACFSTPTGWVVKVGDALLNLKGTEEGEDPSDKIEEEARLSRGERVVCNVRGRGMTGKN